MMASEESENPTHLVCARCGPNATSISYSTADTAVFSLILISRLPSPPKPGDVVGFKDLLNTQDVPAKREKLRKKDIARRSDTLTSATIPTDNLRRVRGIRKQVIPK